MSQTSKKKTLCSVFEKLVWIAKGLNIRFGDGDNPFRIATRLMAECG
jgi:hypothetical protein